MIEGFWERFDECVSEVGINKVQLAKQIGCGRKTLYNTNDGRAMSSLYVARFCSRYGFSADYLLGISNNKKRVAVV
jgi:DNA-binding XRE family transcriptional regulator